MEIIVLGLSCLIFGYCFWLGLQFWLQYKPQKRGDDEQSQIKLTVVGAVESGKTLFLATMGTLLEQYSDSQMSVRLYDDLEEAKLRNMSFNRQGKEQDIPQVGTRSTQEIIRYEREAFLSTKPQDRSVNSTVAESFFLQACFSSLNETQQALKPICLEFVDMPGAFLDDQRSREGHFERFIQTAQGLVIVLEASKLIEVRDDYKNSTYLNLTQAIEAFCQQVQFGPIWLVITQIDQLKNEEQKDLNWWHNHVLNHIIPLLKLESFSNRFELSLSSADLKHEKGSNALKEGSLTYLKRIESYLNFAQQERVLKNQKKQKAKNHLLIALVVSCFAFWAFLGALSILKLPGLEGEVSWDWNSLQTSSQPYLDGYRDSTNFFSPLAPYQHQLRQRLEDLNQIQAKLLHKQSVEILTELSREQDLNTAQQALKRAFDLAQKHQQASAQWLKQKEETAKLKKQIILLLSDLKSWASLLDQDDQFNTMLQRLENFKSSSWSRLCEQTQGRDEFSCLASQNHSTLYQHALNYTLPLAVKQRHSDDLLRQNLSKLLAWRGYADLLEPRSSLLIRYNQMLELSWQDSWNELLSRLNQLKLSEGSQRLKLIEEFEVSRTGLEKKFVRSLPMPKAMNRHWIELLNREVDRQKDSLESHKLIEWAENYLDPQRQARVSLSQFELKWKSTLQQVLSHQQKEAKPFKQSLEMIERDLSELKSLSGTKEIEEAIQVWRTRIDALKEWGKGSELKLNIESIDCDEKRFEQLGLKIDEGSSLIGIPYYPDQLAYYIKIESELESQAKNQMLAQILSGEEKTITWKPWQAMKLSVYDRDHEIDGQEKEQEQEQEQDDDLISEIYDWSEKRDPPNGEISFGPNELCKAVVHASYPLPTWLVELGWLTAL